VDFNRNKVCRELIREGAKTWPPEMQRLRRELVRTEDSVSVDGFSTRCCMLDALLIPLLPTFRRLGPWCRRVFSSGRLFRRGGNRISDLAQPTRLTYEELSLKRLMDWQESQQQQQNFIGTKGGRVGGYEIHKYYDDNGNPAGMKKKERGGGSGKNSDY